MRTTLTIDDDVLLAAKERARRSGRSVGDVLSELARQALLSTARPSGEVADGGGFYGFEPLPHRGRAVSNELIDRLREEEPD
jgi:hypothetical protein